MASFSSVLTGLLLLFFGLLSFVPGLLIGAFYGQVFLFPSAILLTIGVFLLLRFFQLALKSPSYSVKLLRLKNLPWMLLLLILAMLFLNGGLYSLVIFVSNGAVLENPTQVGSLTMTILLLLLCPLLTFFMLRKMLKNPSA